MYFWRKKTRSCRFSTKELQIVENNVQKKVGSAHFWTIESFHYSQNCRTNFGLSGQISTIRRFYCTPFLRAFRAENPHKFPLGRSRRRDQKSGKPKRNVNFGRLQFLFSWKCIFLTAANSQWKWLNTTINQRCKEMQKLLSWVGTHSMLFVVVHFLPKWQAKLQAALTKEISLKLSWPRFYPVFFASGANRRGMLKFPFF